MNIGGVSNVTLIEADLLHACDCGPGNALIDDWVSAHCGVPYDENGRIAAAGRVDPPRQWPATGWLETPQAMTHLLDHLT